MEYVKCPKCMTSNAMKFKTGFNEETKSITMEILSP